MDNAALTAVVRQALGRGSIDIADVQGSPIYGGASSIGQGIVGVYRVIGVAHGMEKDGTWSLIFQLIGVTDANRDPSEPWYWKRELLANQSTHLDQTPGSLRAARCFGTIGILNSLIGL